MKKFSKVPCAVILLGSVGIGNTPLIVVSDKQENVPQTQQDFSP